MAQRTLRGKGLALWTALAVLALDLWSKAEVFALLVQHERRWVVGEWLGLTKVWNRGTMWGHFPEFGDLLPYVRIVAAVIVFVMVLGTPAVSRFMLLALGLVLGGAVGNIYDGFVHEDGVRDFIMVDLGVRFFDPFPIFNVADSAICVGVTILALSMWRAPEAMAEEAAAKAGPPGL